MTDPDFKTDQRPLISAGAAWTAVPLAWIVGMFYYLDKHSSQEAVSEGLLAVTCILGFCGIGAWLFSKMVPDE